MASASTTTSLCPVVDYLSRYIIIHSINGSLLTAETRCQQAMRQSAERRRRMVSELAMRCPPMTIYGPASAAAGDDCPDECDQSVWNYAQTRPLDVVDAVGPSEAARLTDDHVQLIGDRTLGNGSAPNELTSMLRETAKHYVHRELNSFASDVVPALFDVLAARH